MEVDDDDEVMGDDGDDGYATEMKLKGGGTDVLDQEDKDTEEVLDFNFLPGGGSSTAKDPDSVDGIKGDVNDAESNNTQHAVVDGEWGEISLQTFPAGRN